MDRGIAIGNSFRLIHLDGPIELGDAERFIEFIESRPPNCSGRVMLVLNSTGGSLVEGIAIARFVRQKFMTTFVDHDGKCFSACALVFMTGTQYRGDGDFVGRRSMHYDAEVGFHAPFIDTAAISRLPADVQTDYLLGSYQDAIDVAADIILLAIDGRWSPMLVSALMRTAPEEMLQVDTVGKAVAWDIDLVGNINDPSYGIEDIKMACGNRIAVMPQDGSMIAGFQNPQEYFERVYDEAEHWAISQTVYRDEIENGARVVSMEPEMGPNCDFLFPLDDENRPYGEAMSSRLEMLPARTLLKSIEGPEPTGLRSDPSYQPFISEDTTVYWDHNGSKMVVTHVWKDEYTIRYERPRDGLRSIGVERGTILFQGKLSGDRLSGHARLFSPRCGQISYAVTGSFSYDAAQFWLRGQAPTRNSACDVTGYTTTGGNANLGFKRVSR